jgi:hypothetical protein
VGGTHTQKKDYNDAKDPSILILSHPQNREAHKFCTVINSVRVVEKEEEAKTLVGCFVVVVV